MFTPFAGWLFDPSHVSPVGDATSPPYDVISEPERLELLARSPHNVVRLLLAESDDPSYRRAQALLHEWREEGTLRRDDTPRFYLYLMEYEAPDGVRRTAHGVLGALDLVDLGERVLPHEETMAKHRADRMAVLTATRANLDVIIALSSSPDLRESLEPADDSRLDFTTPDGVRHRLYDVPPPQAEAIGAAVAAHPLAIADGHHRYTTALAYRREREAEGLGDGDWTAILALVAPAEGSGLTVGPYHRVFAEFPWDEAAASAAFEVEPSPAAGPAEPGDLVVVWAGGEAVRLQPLPSALETLPGPWRAASQAVARPSSAAWFRMPASGSATAVTSAPSRCCRKRICSCPIMPEPMMP